MEQDLKDVWYSKGQKMHNFTFDASFWKWYVQFPQKFMQCYLILPKIFVLLCFIQLQSSLKEGVAAYCTVHP